MANLGLISQVAEDLWEVKNRTVTNLTKQDITIVDYKKALAKRSELPLTLDPHVADEIPGQAQIEKARLISKNATKGVA